MTKWTLALVFVLALSFSGALIARAEGTALGGGLWFDVVSGFFGIGVQNPTTALEVLGTASSTNLTVSALNAASCDLKASTTGVVSCGTDATGAAAPHVFATSTIVSASDSVNKTVTAWCPVGYRATGGGGQINAGANTDIHMENSYPTATTSGWITSWNEGDAVAGNWQITAHVVCLQI